VPGPLYWASILPTDLDDLPTSGSALYLSFGEFTGSSGAGGTLSDFNAAFQIDFTSGAIEGLLSFFSSSDGEWRLPFWGTSTDGALYTSGFDGGWINGSYADIGGTIFGAFTGAGAPAFAGGFNLSASSGFGGY